VQGPASPFRVPRPQKSHTMLSVGGVAGRGRYIRPAPPTRLKEPWSRLTPPESREAGDPIACSHGYPCSLLGGFFSCPGAWSDAIRNGAPPIASPAGAGFQAEPLRLLANYRPAGKGSTIMLKELQALDDWPLPLGRNQRHVVTTDESLSSGPF